MYLADSMRVIASGFGGTEGFEDIKSLGYAQKRCQDTLEKAELYAFTRSALDVASDLIIDTPERLERVAGAVFEKPRRIFIEALHSERSEAFRTMRGFPFVKKMDHRFDPKRVGIDIECFGDGRARIGAFWNFPKTSTVALLKNARGASKMTRLQKDALKEIMHFGTCLSFLEVDLSRKPELSREDFAVIPEARHPEVARFINLSREQYVNRIDRDVDAPLTQRDHKRIETEAHRLY